MHILKTGLLFLLFFIGNQTVISGQENHTQSIVKVGVYNNKPKIFIKKNGVPDGIFISVINYVAKNENLKIEYVQGNWGQLKNMLENGEIDILPDMAFSSERDSLYSLNKLPVIGSWLEVFSTKKNPINSILDLQGKKIGVLSGSMQSEYLDEVVKQDFNLTFKTIPFVDYESSADALKNGTIDIIVADRFFYFSDYFYKEIVSTGIIFRPADLFFAFTKNKNPELIKLVDKNLSILKNKKDSEYYDSLHRLLDKDYNRSIPIYLKWTFFIVLAFSAISLFFAILLKKRVELKTKELKLKNIDLLNAIEKAKESDHLKTVFLQNMSHEIRTPMNGILGFLDLLKTSNLDNLKRDKYIDVIKISSERLLDTINDIIELSKIESGLIAVNYSNVDVVKTLKEYCDFFKYKANEKGLTINCIQQIDENGAIIKTDSYLLESIFKNLINNAIKFTDSGSIEIGNYLEGENLVFYVKDTGAGIPSNRIEAIFDRFVQSELNITRPHEGSGLGLSIVKSYIEMLNGKIWVNSEMEKGSTFFFSIPYIPVYQEKSLQISNDDELKNMSQKFTILIAEDDEISFFYLENILQNEEIMLIHAKNGLEAVNFLKLNPDISLILMDIKMPEMSGLEATLEIRKFNKSIPIIAQTAFSILGDKENILNSGCNDYIAKPINKIELIKLIKKYLPLN